jgi:AraC-like DNA-binding protein
LSPDRLRHLIREQVGIPLRRYRRWARLLSAVEALRDTASVTAAAHTSGFADSAHLSRVFRDSFTFPPSVFLRDSRFVQARHGRSV